ncbi:hypothetical protein GIB67_009260 [Kingdonia uniflora]|uniref:Myb-like domain-containing protein n=1 Tax=Kingdonia uniflora TaxID=39325 RepID=A0A7J7N2F7_9MAGN|nr:hypothetical protein GIB67_009260 [Kingdonia uniflora]
MYLPDKPRVVDMMIEVVGNGGLQPQEDHHHHHQQQHQMMLGESSGEDGYEVRAPKKRAETWVLEETRSLIVFRREMDNFFNTSKSNKHLWEQISAKMRVKGFDRSPVMCTDKWRNLLKEFKKVKHHHKGSGSAKMSYYKEIEELLKERNNNAAAAYKSPPASKVDSYIQFSDKGLEDTNIPFGSAEASARSSLNLERRLDHEGHPLAITVSDTVEANELPSWNWRATPGNGVENQAYTGRVISVKWGDFTRRIGVEGTADAIKEAIKSSFGLRTKRAFWLEDEEEVVRSLDRDMPLGNYTLHLDEGVTIRICTLDESTHMPLSTEEMTLYTEDDFRDMLFRRSWGCLREYTEAIRNVETLTDLQSGSVYRGLKLSGA